MADIQVTPWAGDAPPTEDAVLDQLTADGLTAYGWSNDPGDVYAAHTHHYHKIIYVARGSITFGLPELGREVALSAGDRLDLPDGILHNATVGPRGVLCYEAHVE